MSNLFVTPENVDVSIFRLPKYGSLKRKEASWFEKRDQAVMTGMIEILQISKEISITQNVDPATAYQIVSAYGTENGSELLVPYADRMSPIVDIITSSAQAPSAAFTMFLQSRLPKSWIEENTGQLDTCYGIKVNGADHWKTEFTEELPEAIVNEVWEFIQNEKLQWKDTSPIAKSSDKKDEADPLGEESGSTKKDLISA
jgi:hypothetical protein